MFGSLIPAPLCIFLFLTWASGQSVGQTKPPDELSSAQAAIKVAQAGRCQEAVPGLKKASRLTDKDLRRSAGFAGVRCAMILNQTGMALDFLRMLNREFPRDPELLYVSVHTYSDLSTRAAQQLATTAPNSAQAHELNAESLEVQGKWDEAGKEYRQILQINSQLPGIDFKLGRLLLSQPNTPADAARTAQNAS